MGVTWRKIYRKNCQNIINNANVQLKKIIYAMILIGEVIKGILEVKKLVLWRKKGGKSLSCYTAGKIQRRHV